MLLRDGGWEVCVLWAAVLTLVLTRVVLWRTVVFSDAEDLRCKKVVPRRLPSPW